MQPPEDRRRRPRLGVVPAADEMDARQMEERVTSGLPMHVQVSLIDRGVRFIEASFPKPAPRFLPVGSTTTARASEPGPACGGVSVGVPKRTFALWMHARSQPCKSEPDADRKPPDSPEPSPSSLQLGSCANRGGVQVEPGHPLRVNSCCRWCVRKDTQAFRRAVRRAVTRALPQAVMIARPRLARICR